MLLLIGTSVCTCNKINNKIIKYISPGISVRHVPVCVCPCPAQTTQTLFAPLPYYNFHFPRYMRDFLSPGIKKPHVVQNYICIAPCLFISCQPFYDISYQTISCQTISFYLPTVEWVYHTSHLSYLIPQPSLGISTTRSGCPEITSCSFIYY